MVNERRRPHEEDLSEADRVLLGLLDKSRTPIPWDESDDAILAAAGAARSGGTMEDELDEADRVLFGLLDRSQAPIPWDESDNAILAAARTAQSGATVEDELDEADKVVLELYRRGKAPVPWDEKDDAILTFARQASTANDDRPVSTAGSGEPETPLGDNVVRFPAHRIVRRVFATPAAGWAIAASIMVGIFVGQGITPYVNLGVAPDVPGLLAENARLSGEVSSAQGEIMRLSQEFTQTGIRFKGEEPGPAPETETTALLVPGIAELGRALDQFKCAALSATVRQGSSLVIRGHVASADDMNRLLAVLAPYTEVSRVSNRAQVYAWPRCEAIEILETLTTANAPAVGPSVRPVEHGSVYRAGESLVLDAIAADTPGYLYVDFVQNDGTVVHLVSGRRVAAGERIRVGAGDLNLIVAPPFGAETLSIVQSAEPLFDAGRPQVERADAYLPVLRKALEAVGDAGTLASGFTFLTTLPAP